MCETIEPSLSSHGKGRRVTSEVNKPGDPDLAQVVRACEELLNPPASGSLSRAIQVAWRYVSSTLSGQSTLVIPSCVVYPAV